MLNNQIEIFEIRKLENFGNVFRNYGFTNRIYFCFLFFFWQNYIIPLDFETVKIKNGTI